MDGNEGRRDMQMSRSPTEELLAAERKRALAETAGAVSHEINQPLTVVMGLTQLLLENSEPGCPERYQLEHIWEACEQIRSIVRNMASVCRYETKPYAEGARIVDLEAASHGLAPVRPSARCRQDTDALCPGRDRSPLHGVTDQRYSSTSLRQCAHRHDGVDVRYSEVQEGRH
jgi:signal transduction histidine kinase